MTPHALRSSNHTQWQHSIEEIFLLPVNVAGLVETDSDHPTVHPEFSLSLHLQLQQNELHEINPVQK